MSDPAAVAAYRAALDRTGQSVTFRRVGGQAPRTAIFDATVQAVFRNYQSASAIGPGARQASITEGVREFIVLEDDLRTKRFPLPLRKNDKIVVGAEVFNIIELDPGKRVFAGAIEGKAIGV